MAAGRAVQEAQALVSRKFAGQPHFDYLLEAAAAGLVQGAGAGLQKVGNQRAGGGGTSRGASCVAMLPCLQLAASCADVGTWI